MYLILTENTAHWAAGELVVADDTWTFTQLRLPYATQVRATGRAMAVQYENRKYITGQVSVPMMVDEYLRSHVLGIDPPRSAPAVVPAGAAAICYLRFVDDLTEERSPLSAGTEVGAGPYTWTLPTPGYDVHPGTVTFAAGTVTGSGTSFGMMRPGDRVAASSAPTRYAMIKTITSDDTMTVDDAGIAAGPGDSLHVRPVLRYSHIELWRSVSGGLPRFVMRVPYGLASVTENVAALALGEAETTSFTRMPYGTICAIYHDRLAIAGDPEDPAVVYLSAQFYPERYEGLYYRTRSGRPIVALLTVRDHLLIMTDQDAEILQGYTDTDMVMEVKDPLIGALSQHLTCMVHGDAWIVSTKGWFMYNGEFHQMCSARLTEWKTLTAYMDMTQSHMYYNSFDQTVQVALRRLYKPSAAENLYKDELVWVADISQVSPLVGGGYTQPRWFEDEYDVPSYTDRWTTAEMFPDDRTYPMPRLFCFTEDGYCYREMQDWTESWKGVSYSNAIGGNFYLNFPMYMLGDVGGDIQEGKNLTRFWLYCKSEHQDQTLNLYGGDEYAMWRLMFHRYGYQSVNYGEPPIFWTPGQAHYPIPAIPWSDTIPASLIHPGTNPDPLKAAKIVHECVPEKVSGRGFGLSLSISNPQAVVFFGFGGQYKPGISYRGKDSYNYDAP